MNRTQAPKRQAYLETAIANALKWARSAKTNLERKGWKSQEIADHILAEVGRMPCGIGCQRAVEKELGLSFTQPTDEPEDFEEDEEEKS